MLVVGGQEAYGNTVDRVQIMNDSPWAHCCRLLNLHSSQPAQIALMEFESRVQERVGGYLCAVCALHIRTVLMPSFNNF